MIKKRDFVSSQNNRNISDFLIPLIPLNNKGDVETWKRRKKKTKMKRNNNNNNKKEAGEKGIKGKISKG